MDKKQLTELLTIDMPGLAKIEELQSLNFWAWAPQLGDEALEEWYGYRVSAQKRRPALHHRLGYFVSLEGRLVTDICPPATYANNLLGWIRCVLYALGSRTGWYDVAQPLSSILYALDKKYSSLFNVDGYLLVLESNILCGTEREPVVTARVYRINGYALRRKLAEEAALAKEPADPSWNQ